MSSISMAAMAVRCESAELPAENTEDAEAAAAAARTSPIGEGDEGVADEVDAGEPAAVVDEAATDNDDASARLMSSCNLRKFVTDMFAPAFEFPKPTKRKSFGEKIGLDGGARAVRIVSTGDQPLLPVDAEIEYRKEYLCIQQQQSATIN